jgi:hypothetical protein
MPRATVVEAAGDLLRTVLLGRHDAERAHCCSSDQGVVQRAIHKTEEGQQHQFRLKFDFLPPVPSIGSMLHSVRKGAKISPRETPAQALVAPARALRPYKRAGGASLPAAARAFSSGTGQLQAAAHSAFAAPLRWRDRLAGGSIAVCPPLP